MSKESILLLRQEDNLSVEASLLGDLKPDDLRLVERVWTLRRQEMMRDLVTQNVPRLAWPQSLHWDWSAKAHELGLLSHYGWAVECDGDFQGVMLVDLASHFADLDDDRGKPVLYIEYLEAAPWNWDCPELSQQKRYRGIGTTLFQKAVEQSSEQGFHGRIGLHALPQAESFYQQACGMTRFGKDPDKEGLVYFELSRADAAERLT